MNKIYFSKDTSKVSFDTVDNDTYCVYHESYTPPSVSSVKYIPFKEYKNVYHNIYSSCLVFVGLNKIMRPSNRTDFIFEHIFTLSRNIPKISIDSSPFIGEPWRLWFHYGMVGCGKFGVPHSYAIETEWKHWFLRNINTSRFESDNLSACIDSTTSLLDKKNISVSFGDVSENEIGVYNEIKEHVFSKYHTPKMLINNMLKECNKRYGLKYSFESYLNKGDVSLPSLPIYKFVHEENKRRVDIYNCFSKEKI